MAKSHSFFGLRRGSTKSFTFSVLGGQQITKDRVSEVRNPRSYSQQFQRAKFASMVKFFKQLPQGLLTNAYEDKLPTESYYNAFMRHNANRICTYLADQNANDNILASGDVMLSYGSLRRITLNRGTIGEGALEFASNIPTGEASGEISTVAQLSQHLIAYGYAAGDIVNIVAQFNPTVYGIAAAPYIAELSGGTVITIILSCILDTTDETSIASHLNPNDEQYEAILGLKADGLLTITLASAEDAMNANVAFIVSRKTSSGVKVSTSNMTCAEAWPLEKMRFDAYAPIPSRPGVAPATNWTELVAQSYDGKEGETILQGGLVTEGEVTLRIVSLGQPTPGTIAHTSSVTFNRPTTFEELAGRLQLVASEGSFTLNNEGRFMAGSTQVTSAGNMSPDGLTFKIGVVQSGFASTTISDVVLAEQ